VRTDAKTLQAYNWNVAFKYVLTHGGILNQLAHFRQFSLVKYYHAQSAAKGSACVIDVVPEQVEFLEN
jgi:hypothetical protein